jgi:hypothetical protein
MPARVHPKKRNHVTDVGKLVFYALLQAVVMGVVALMV